MGIEYSIRGYHIYVQEHLIWTPVIYEVLVYERAESDTIFMIRLREFRSLMDPWGPANELLEK